ncbi:hypothetical protein MRX96_025821 [Rhipicephalus microplus]
MVHSSVWFGAQKKEKKKECCMDRCVDALFSDQLRILLQDRSRNVQACHAHFAMKKAAVQTNPFKTTTGQVSSSYARQTKRAKPVDNSAVPDQLLCSARHAKTAKPTAMRSASGQPCSPPYTRSQPECFEKQSALRRTLTEKRQGSWQKTSRSALAESGNKLPAKKLGTPAKAAAAAETSR